MLRPDLIDAQRLLRVPRSVRGDLRRSSAPPSLLFQPRFDLLPSRTRCIQILARIAFDLRLAMRAALDFVAHPLQPRRQLRAVNSRRVLLRLVKFLSLQRARFALRRLRHIEDHRVRVQLRRGVAIDRARCCRARTWPPPMRPSSPLERCRRCAPARTFPSRPAPRARSPGAPLSRDCRRRQAPSARPISARKTSRPTPPGAPSPAPFRLAHSRIRAPAGGGSTPRPSADAGPRESRANCSSLTSPRSP